MIRLQALTLSLVALVACTSTRNAQVSAPPLVTTPAIAVAEDAAAPVSSDAASDAASADAATDDAPTARAQPDPHLVRLRALAADDATLRAGIDPARGVTMIRYLEAPPSGEGREEHTSRRLCGATLARALPSVRRALNAAIEQSTANESFDCEGDVCTVAGMEYQPVHRLYFVTTGDTITLEAIAQVSEAAMASEWLLRATDFVTRNLTAARAHPCAQSGR